MSTANPVRRVAASLLRHASSNMIGGAVLLPFWRAKHRALLKSAKRSDSHTYTSFYRSPRQLEALTGPVVDHLLASGRKEISILVFAGSNGSEAYTMASQLMAVRPEVRFSIRASDLHAETVAKATAALYTLDEITQGLDVPAEFLARTFDREGDAWRVKPAIRARVTFERADLLANDLAQQFSPADLVVAQNVLFHMPPEMARRAFASIVSFLAPGAVLFIDGMELDMRVELTAHYRPLDYHVREIYEYSRRHIPPNWWDYYYGNEPYFPLARERLRRYGTIFYT